LAVACDEAQGTKVATTKVSEGKTAGRANKRGRNLHTAGLDRESSRCLLLGF